MSEKIKNDAKEENKEEYVIRLEEEYQFEGTAYKEINLDGILTLTGSNLEYAEKLAVRENGNSLQVEFSLYFAFVIAHLSSGLPIEFFRLLPLKEAVKVKYKVRNFLF